MNGKDLYEMFVEELYSECADFVSQPWVELDPSKQIAWGSLCRRLQREHHLTPDTTLPQRFAAAMLEVSTPELEELKTFLNSI